MAPGGAIATGRDDDASAGSNWGTDRVEEAEAPRADCAAHNQVLTDSTRWLFSDPLWVWWRLPGLEAKEEPCP